MVYKKQAESKAENIVKRVLKDDQLLFEVYKGVTSKDDSVRYPNAIALEILSNEHPEMIYPEWDFFIDLLNRRKAYSKSIAIKTIANLTRVDTEDRFDNLFNDYYNELNDKSVIVSRQLAINSGKIAKAKPKLQTKITNKLLSIDKTHHNLNRKDLIKGDIIGAFSEYYEEIESKMEIIEFVKKQLKSTSPSTVKKAKEFLKKWENKYE